MGKEKTMKYLAPLIFVLLLGCSTLPAIAPLPSLLKSEYTIYRLEKGVEIVVMNRDMAEKACHEITGKSVPGCTEIFRDGDRIYVSYDYIHVLDKFGNPMPNFEILGHEIWHLIKRDFH